MVSKASDQNTGPDFILIGAPKCGTTSIYHYLQQHPQIHMSALKEPHFFLFDGPEKPGFGGPKDAMRRREMIQSWDHYQAFFRAVPEGKICVFHAKPATDSSAKLPPIPDESCHRFQGKAATLVGGG